MTTSCVIIVKMILQHVRKPIILNSVMELAMTMLSSVPNIALNDGITISLSRVCLSMELLRELTFDQNARGILFSGGFMEKTKVYVKNRVLNMATEDVFGEMIRAKENIAYSQNAPIWSMRDGYAAYLALRAINVIEKEIEIHKKLYPWYSGYAWHEGGDDIPDPISKRESFKHKSFCIAARYE
jgi:hypothetical protein